MVYRILLRGNIDTKLLREIQSRHSEDIEGIEELYEQLIANGSCDSAEAAKIYYTAYTLALENIEMIIVQVN